MLELQFLFSGTGGLSSFVLSCASEAGKVCPGPVVFWGVLDTDEVCLEVEIAETGATACAAGIGAEPHLLSSDGRGRDGGNGDLDCGDFLPGGALGGDLGLGGGGGGLEALVGTGSLDSSLSEGTPALEDGSKSSKSTGTEMLPDGVKLSWGLLFTAAAMRAVRATTVNIGRAALGLL